MFTASPAEILVAGIALGSVVAWLDSLTTAPEAHEQTVWGRLPAPAKVTEILALTAPVAVVPLTMPAVQAQPPQAEQVAPAPKLAAAAIKSSAGNASRPASPKGKGSQAPRRD